MCFSQPDEGSQLASHYARGSEPQQEENYKRTEIISVGIMLLCFSVVFF